jgi:hypothetical protein
MRKCDAVVLHIGLTDDPDVLWRFVEETADIVFALGTGDNEQLSMEKVRLHIKTQCLPSLGLGVG